MTDWLKGFDVYSRTARLYPALIAVIPLAGLLFLPATSIVEVLIRGGGLAVCAGAIAYFFSGYVRFRGKNVEAAIVQRMGGWPSTTLLRHRDATIDSMTKARYHNALGALSGVKLPTTAEEAVESQAADDAYRSATKALMEARRGPEYSMLLAENASYGFWRNLYAVKSIAVGLAAAVAIASAVALCIDIHGATSWTPKAAHYVYTVAFEAVYDLLMLLIVNERMVHMAAVSYAVALLRTLDAPSK